MSQSNRINEKITANNVVLISSDGVNQGEIAKYKALQIAKEQGQDLVEVSPGRVPVCKIMDYGKLCYQRSKAEKHNKGPQLKEIWFKYKTDQRDIEIKKNKIREFLENGHKVLIGMKLAGREKQFTGTKEKFFESVKDLSDKIKLSDISMSDSNLTMMLNPD